MSPLLKQRLVGALVLVAIGVVFWPLIFVTPENREPLVLQPMSQRPLIDQKPIPVLRGKLWRRFQLGNRYPPHNPEPLPLLRNRSLTMRD